MNSHFPSFPTEAFGKALCWREEHPLLQNRETLRLVAGISDECPGWLIDRYGPGIVATHYGNTKDPTGTYDALKDCFSTETLLFKYRNQDSQFQSMGHGAPWKCESLGLQWEIRPDIRHDFGLFLDTHSSRVWIEKVSKSKRVLNLFAYTCAFGLVAAKGEASHITNIDASKTYLDWGRLNATENQLDFRNLEDTVQKYMARHLRRLESGKDVPYDLTIADPPAFLVGRGDDRLGRKLWPNLLEQLDQSGSERLLLINNDRSFLKNRSWRAYVSEHLPHFELQELPHTPDCEGQYPKGVDPHYTVPEVLIARRPTPR